MANKPFNCEEATELAKSVYPYANFLTRFIPNVITKLGEEGCLWVGQESAHYFSPEVIQKDEIKSVTGAGDCFVGTLLANLQRHYAHSHHPCDIPSEDVFHHIIRNCQRSSIRTLQSDLAVSDKISKDLLV
ncbi:hypothetical protein BDF20DRAFT_23389 [Mycotypha africana]|uniref:uncharacterized protein n=1 Tax=Mycotypha africana TaxID=64632 RepID=UPI0023018E80|nr:uncharacterized protein BDF20DRAFT_23389 [Mycotypha africana]KAI8991113.1 hypothetical protein BDF20DRAFT_23389 [Mycotypha africana]